MTTNFRCPLCQALIPAVTDAERRAADREGRRQWRDLRTTVLVCTPCAQQRGVAVQAAMAMEVGG